MPATWANWKSARHLLAQGADLNWVGHNQQTPLDAAVHKGHEETRGLVDLQTTR
jgi:ankyrin repeat protein